MTRKDKVILAVMSAIMAVVILCVITIGCIVVNKGKYVTIYEEDEGGMVVSTLQDDEYTGLSITATALSTLDSTSSSTCTITATVSGVSDGEETNAVNWSIAWGSTSDYPSASSWVSGKKVTDYVTVTSTGTYKAKVTCLQEFAMQAIITAELDGFTATCTVDYQQKVVDGVTLSLGYSEDNPIAYFDHTAYYIDGDDPDGGLSTQTIACKCVLNSEDDDYDNYLPFYMDLPTSDEESSYATYDIPEDSDGTLYPYITYSVSDLYTISGNFSDVIEYDSITLWPYSEYFFGGYDWGDYQVTEYDFASEGIQFSLEFWNDAFALSLSEDDDWDTIVAHLGNVMAVDWDYTDTGTAAYYREILVCEVVISGVDYYGYFYIENCCLGYTSNAGYTELE